jgi:hypothetical protein
LRWLVVFGRGTILLVALGAALLAGPREPAQAQTVLLKFDPSPKYGPTETAYYGAVNADVFTLNVGDVAASARRAQGFKLSATTRVVRVGLWLKKAGIPTDNLTVEIQTDTGGLPSGTAVPNGTSNAVAASALASGAFKLVTFIFAVPPQLTGNTQYHLVLKRSGSLSASHYYIWGADQSSPSYADGAGSVFDSGTSTWTAASPATDHVFGVNPTRIDVLVEGLTVGNDLGAYEVTVSFDPAVVTPVAANDGGFLGSTGRSVSCLTAQYGVGTLNLSCTTLGSTPAGPTGGGIMVVINFASVAAGSSSLDLTGDCQSPDGEKTCIARPFGSVIPHDRLSGSITMQALGSALGDSDGDGCSDVEEAGDNITAGGDRDWNNPWDFYSVPVPARADPEPNGTRNLAIDISDVLAVLFYTGADDDGPINGNGVDYDSDKNGDTVEDGRDYDRSPNAPTSGPPDGAISVSDVLAALGQSGHSCVGP